ADYRKWVAMHVEVLNHAIEGLPSDRVRYHVCWGSWPGPHTTDVPLKDIVDLILKVNVGAYVIEGGQSASRPRMEGGEGRHAAGGQGPHPRRSQPCHQCGGTPRARRRAHRPLRYASRARECARRKGFAQGPFYRRVHPSIMWAKLEALAEGARLASKKLWSCRLLRAVHP